jgi:hypothetical protein
MLPENIAVEFAVGWTADDSPENGLLSELRDGSIGAIIL